MQMKRGEYLLSSRKMTVIILMVLFVPLTVFFIGYNVVAMNTMNERISSTNRNVLSFYKEAIEFDLKKIELNLAEIVANDNDYRKLLNKTTELEAHQASYEIVEKGKTILKMFPQIMGIYIYSPKNNIFRSAYNEGYRYAQKTAVEEFVRRIGEEEEPREGWFIQSIDDKWYLIRSLGLKQTYMICAIPLEQIMTGDRMAEADGYVVFSSVDGQPYTMTEFINQGQIDLKGEFGSFSITGKQKNFFIVQTDMEWEDDVRLSYITYYDGVWAIMDRGWTVLMLLFLFVFSAAFICYRLLQWIYFQPLQQFVNTMNEIRAGGLDRKMSRKYVLQELNIVSSTFNSMMEEMKQLKILAYEKEMENQRVQLQRLQIQIRPHFFLNCLKNLFGMAQERKYKEIQNMVVMLSSHCRYILRDVSAMVMIKEEIESVQNYIDLQKISATYEMECISDIEEDLLSVSIPQMCILTFVENAVKHGICLNKKLRILIKVRKLASEEEECINISILDNGRGFPQEILKKINGNTEEKEMNGHIGIYNVKKRLELLYGKRSVIFFANQSQGASIEIFIPMEEMHKA